MILYKKDSKGKLRSLEIITVGDKLFQISGLVDGAKVTSSRTCKAKNIGKSNETTAEEQALLEAQSKVNDKLTNGYFESIDELENSNVILPMLAKDYKKEKHKVEFPCYAQPKLDGMRALLINGQFISRQGKHISTIKHLNIESDFILDGELYSHGESFQSNMKLIKKYRGVESEVIKFHVYDIVSDDSYKFRKDIVESLTQDGIEIVKTISITNEIELKEFHSQNLNEGYEGTIVRWGDSPYKVSGRSSNLLKYKDFIDITLPVKDVIPSDKRPEQGSCVFEWQGATGHKLGDNIIGCGMKFSHDERENILINKEKYIGKIAELRFFEYSDTGVPRFPVCVGFRLDK